MHTMAVLDLLLERENKMRNDVDQTEELFEVVVARDRVVFASWLFLACFLRRMESVWKRYTDRAVELYEIARMEAWNVDASAFSRHFLR